MRKMTKLLLVSFSLLFIITNVEIGLPNQNHTSYDFPDITDRSVVTKTVSHNDEDASPKEIRAYAKSAVKIREDIVLEDINGNVEIFIGASSGSGTTLVTDEYKNSSLILTADHVCTFSYNVGEVVGYGRYVIRNTRKKVINIYGDEFDAEIFITDSLNDVCIMKVDGVTGMAGTLSAFLPDEPGSKIFTAGSPLGVWGSGSSNVVEGYYSGILTDSIDVSTDEGIVSFSGFLQYSIPIVGGMSGSAVYYKGRIIGLITVGSPRYEHVGWGPGIGPIRELFDVAYDRWRFGVVK